MQVLFAVNHRSLIVSNMSGRMRSPEYMYADGPIRRRCRPVAMGPLALHRMEPPLIKALLTCNVHPSQTSRVSGSTITPRSDAPTRLFPKILLRNARPMHPSIPFPIPPHNPERRSLKYSFRSSPTPSLEATVPSNDAPWHPDSVVAPASPCDSPSRASSCYSSR